MRVRSQRAGIRLTLFARLSLAMFVTTGWSDCYADLLAGNYALGTIHRFDDLTGAVVADDITIGGINTTAGLAVGPDGNIYVSSQATGEILFYNGATGAPLPSPHVDGAAGLFAALATEETPNSTPGPLRFGPDGHLYVSDFGGSTVRVFHGTTAEELDPVGEGFAPPGGLAFAPNGDLYVGNFGTASIIRIHEGRQDPVVTSGTSPLQTPSALLFLPNGDLLVVDLFGNQILRYDPHGAYLGQFAEIEPTGMGTNYPSDIAYDADGNLVVAVLGATFDNVGQILRFGLSDGSIAGIPLGILVDEYPPLSSLAWIASPDTIPGDFDGNGSVGIEDYERWSSDFGKWVATGGGADGNANGIVDAADYVMWRDRLGAATGDSLNQATVPEPTAAALFVLAMLVGAAFQVATRGGHCFFQCAFTGRASGTHTSIV